MNTITSAELRSLFLTYFQDKGHQVVAGSSLVPVNDPSLLFTNAGMVQFKEVFLGSDIRDYSRAVSSQRCVRAGGKHNDLENVGYTARHHTFFEMLGNFSFGDYFKREAIHFAWDFLTRVLQLPPERLWITVYVDDKEAADIWLNELQVSSERFSRIDGSDNFWSMGDSGPCGPCSEIFYDHGESVAGGPPGTPEAEGDRYVEIWNLVFMQYDRAVDGSLSPLPKPSVDTGMGLERLAAVMQGVHSNYDIDLFQHLIAAAARVVGCEIQGQVSLKVLADHIRSCTFLIVDGVLPSNEGRGYVLRRILRRAIRHGYQLGTRDAFFHKLVSPLVKEMGQAYPELVRRQNTVELIVAQEESRFADTLDHGMTLLEQVLSSSADRTLSGDLVFKLYDTYGFPADLTADIARERGFAIDLDGFEKAMEVQRSRARAAQRFGAMETLSLPDLPATAFQGYESLTEMVKIAGLLRHGQPVAALSENEEGQVVLAATPFYAESGGQVGDQGVLDSADARFLVTDTRKQGGIFLHVGQCERGLLRVGDTLEARVDESRRQITALNHSATHLLHAALRRILGDHVEQKGSLVEPTRLRFDFSHFQPLTAEQLRQVETLVNDQIRADWLVTTRIMALQEAVDAGAAALFGEKYDETVRVLQMGDFSMELCGGTHVRRTGEIGVFRIVEETGIAAGVRRLEAITGKAALNRIQDQRQQIEQLSGLLRCDEDALLDRVQRLLENIRQQDKTIANFKDQQARYHEQQLLSQAVDVQGINVLAVRVDDLDSRQWRDTVDRLKSALQPAVVVLAAVETDNKVRLIAGVTSDQTQKLKAGELVNGVARQIGGKGGGRPDMAQAGGTDPDRLPEALASVVDWVRSRMA